MVKVNRKEAEPMKEGYVDNRFASLYYKEMGQGMPLIMLHGNGESHEIFARLSELMSRYYRVILMDSRGHGSSLMKEEAAGGDLTIPDMAADVVQVMEFLHVPRAGYWASATGQMWPWRQPAAIRGVCPPWWRSAEMPCPEE